MRKAAVAVMAVIIAGCGGGGSDSSSTDTAVSATPQADSPSVVATSPAPATSPTPATPSPASPSPPAASPTPTTAVPVPGPAPATEVRTITAQELIQALTHGVPQDAEYPVGAGNNPWTIAGWMLDHSRRAYPESGEPIVVSGGTWGNPVLHSDLTDRSVGLARYCATPLIQASRIRRPHCAEA